MFTTMGNRRSARSAYPCGRAAIAGGTVTAGPAVTGRAGAAGTAAAFVTGAGAAGAGAAAAPKPSETSTSVDANVAKCDRAAEREMEARDMERSSIVVTGAKPKRTLRISLATVEADAGKSTFIFP